jgi:hypothetical protein
LYEIIFDTKMCKGIPAYGKRKKKTNGQRKKEGL